MLIILQYNYITLDALQRRQKHCIDVRFISEDALGHKLQENISYYQHISIRLLYIEYIGLG